MIPTPDLANNATVTESNNPALKDFNKSEKKTQSKKTSDNKKKQSQKFPMPKTYTPNEYPDRNLSPLELTREMIEFYDFKNKPESYNKFVENTLNYKKKQKKKANKHKAKEPKEEQKSENKNHEN